MNGRTGLRSLPGRRALAAMLLGAGTLAVLSVALVVGFAPQPRPSSSAPVTRANPTLIDVDTLAANGLLGQLGTEPFLSLRNDVLSQARHALQREPRSGPLPDAVGDLRDDGKAALALAVAFVVTGDSRYGRGAGEYLDAWAAAGTLDPGCVEADCDRAWRIARDLPALVFAADLIRGSPAMNDGQAHRFADWLVAIRPAATRSDTFEGDAVVLARVLIAAYLADATLLDAAIGEWRARLGLLHADGRVSSAATAESPITDTQEALTYRLLAARIAEDHGRAVLDATGSSGVSIHAATDRLAADWMDPASWPGTSRPPAGPLWEIAYAIWPDARYVPLLTGYRSGGGSSLVALRWSTLFESHVSAVAASPPAVAGAATPSPATPTPGPTPTLSPAPTPSATPRPGPLADTPTIEFSRGSVGTDRSRVRLSWPRAQRAAEDRSALSYRVESAVGDGAYRLLGEGPRRVAETTLAVASERRFRLRAATEAAGPGPWSGELIVRLRRYQDRHASIETTGPWSSASATAYSDGRVRYSTRRGATMTVQFLGRAVAIRAPIGPTRGQVDVIVDGQTVERVDLGADRFVGSVVVFEQAWPTDGDHRIRLRVVGTTGRAVVAIDAFDVLDSGG
jgi:hypothetical protein